MSYADVKLNETVSKAIDEYIQSGHEIREAVAVCLGSIMGKYLVLGNDKAAKAIETAHNIFMDEMK